KPCGAPSRARAGPLGRALEKFVAGVTVVSDGRRACGVDGEAGWGRCCRRLSIRAKGEIVAKRVLVLSAALLAMCVAAGSAGAGLGGPPSVQTVSFVGGAGLSSATCAFVPAGTTISWTGPERSTTIVRTDATGVTTVQVVSHASGPAAANNGNSYAFNYSNAFRVSNSVD